MALIWKWLSCVVGVAILTGVVLDRDYFHQQARDTEAYHAQVRMVASQMPIDMDGWLGSEYPVPAAAVKLLRPNVIISREFRNPNTGRDVSYLIEQCKDARDMIGHYPPQCYPAHGWEMMECTRKDWPTDGGLVIHGNSYVFMQTRVTGKEYQKIFNFMVLPDGRTAPEMSDVYTVARDRGKRYFGAGQVQIVMRNLSMSQQEEAEVINLVLRVIRPTMDAILKPESSDEPKSK